MCFRYTHKIHLSHMIRLPTFGWIYGNLVRITILLMLQQKSQVPTTWWMYILKKNLVKNHGRKINFQIYHTIPPSNWLNSKNSPRGNPQPFPMGIPMGSYGILPVETSGWGGPTPQRWRKTVKRWDFFFRVEEICRSEKMVFFWGNEKKNTHTIWSNYSDQKHEFFTLNGGLVREISLFQGNLGWWNIIIWPDTIHVWYIYLHGWLDFWWYM